MKASVHTNTERVFFVNIEPRLSNKPIEALIPTIIKEINSEQYQERAVLDLEDMFDAYYRQQFSSDLNIPIIVEPNGTVLVTPEHWAEYISSPNRSVVLKRMLRDFTDAATTHIGVIKAEEASFAESQYNIFS